MKKNKKFLIKASNKEKSLIIITITLFFLSFNLFILNLNGIQNDLKPEFQGDIHISGEIPYTRQWLENSIFDEPIDPWFSEEEGDRSDVNTFTGLGQANYVVLGDRRTFSNISGTPQETEWINVTNSAFPALPDSHEIDLYGCHASHVWVDPTDPIQTPSIHWDRNVTMPVNMSDYVITSASLKAVFNASVTTESGNNPGGTPIYPGVDCPNDNPPQQPQYDFVRFYVLISDIEKNEVVEVAYNQTVDLGQDSPEISNITDREMITIPEESLIFYLTSILKRDSFHFTITLGILISCADNYNYDIDSWDHLRIKSCDLTFTYEKKINQFTSVSWNQIGDEITGNNTKITNANLKFKYKIDNLWPESSSPNSEIRILINDNQHSETIKLNSANGSFQEAKPAGYNVTSLILQDVNISLSIQVFLADLFLLDRFITISIDDVYLEISYIEITDDLILEPEIFGRLLIPAIISILLLGAYFIAYQRVFKYPKTVRKVRKFRKTLKRKHPPGRIYIINRDYAFKTLYEKESSKVPKPKSSKPEMTPQLPVIELKAKPESKPKEKLPSIEKKLPIKKEKPTEKPITPNNKSKVKTKEKKSFIDKLNEKLPKKSGNKKASKKNGKKLLFLTLILFFLLLNIFILNVNKNQNSNKFLYNSWNSIETMSQGKIHISGVIPHTEQWLENPTFEDPIDPWFSSVEGDESDVDAITSPGQINYEIYGNRRIFSNISGIPQNYDWEVVQNPAFPVFPDSYEIDSEGCHVSHTYAESADQSPSIHWDRNITMPVDMSDYIITSASIEATVNATVTASPGGWGGGGVECPGDATDLGGTQNYTFDYVRFYVIFSDLEKNKIYEVSYNQTVDLGHDAAGITDIMNDTLMTTVSEEDLIFFLTSVLSSDNSNFTITLGMRIWCEDNFVSDRDTWNSLRIKSCNLTFTYEKKIDQFTTVDYNQIGDKITGTNVQITSANLKFKYKINDTWPELSSPNSEIRILINNNSHTETIKLSTANTSFQEIKPGGYDVSSLILIDINISLSLQVFLADEFALDKNFSISIDDVYLEISYIEIIPDIFEEPWVFSALLILAITVLTSLGSYFFVYRRYLKYPKPVRKVRKFRKTLKRKHPPGTVYITNREYAFKTLHEKEVSKAIKVKKSAAEEKPMSSIQKFKSKFKSKPKKKPSIPAKKLIAKLKPPEKSPSPTKKPIVKKEEPISAEKKSKKLSDISKEKTSEKSAKKD